MDMFIEFVGTLPTFAFAYMVINPSPNFLPGFPTVCLNVTHVAYQEIHDIPGVTVNMGPDFPNFTVGTSERRAWLDVIEEA